MENEQVKDREDKSSATTALTTQASPDQMRTNMQRMSEMIKLKKLFLQENLQKGIENDYAEIPGTNKLSLLKPGAEKLLDWHGYYAKFVLTSEKEDWGAGLFAYTYRCEIRMKGSNDLVADCEGDASSYESKYRFEWKYGDKLPAGTKTEGLLSRGEGNSIQYQVIVANPADKRNTIRKMAQKRALIGATVVATATSGLFAADVDPDDESGSGGHQQESGGNGERNSTPSGDHGGPISDKQSKRLYAIRKNHNINDGEFKAWLKAKYGIDDDRKIGYKVYEDICKACESGHLEIPASKPTSETAKPESSQQEPASSAPASGGKITVAQVKDFYMLLTSLGKSEHDFKEWLPIAMPKYEGKGVNDLQSADVDYIKEQYTMYCQGEAA